MQKESPWPSHEQFAAIFVANSTRFGLCCFCILYSAVLVEFQNGRIYKPENLVEKNVEIFFKYKIETEFPFLSELQKYIFISD